MRKHTTQITNAHMGQSNRQWQQWAIRARKGWKERRKEAKGWGENEGGLWGEARSTAGDLHCGKTDQSQTGGRGWTPPPPFLLHRSNQTFPSHSQSPAAPCERRIKPRRSSCLKSAHTIVAIMKTDYHTASDISDKEELGSPVLPLMSRSSLFALIPLNSKFHYPAPSTIWLSWARLILTRVLMYGKCICWGGYTSVPILLFPVPSLKSIVWPVSFRLKSTVRTKGELFEN